MGSQCDLFCWEIMQCENSEDCPAKMYPAKSCWKIASESDDYRKANNICRDCIVHVLKTGHSVLSNQEIHKILEKKVTLNWPIVTQDLLRK